MRKIKIYTDEDVYVQLAPALRKHGIDAESVLEANRSGLEDYEQLDYAVNNQRAILTFNRQHYEELAVEYFLKDKTHYGIIISPQYNFKELLRRLLVLLKERDADELENQIVYLQSFK